MIKNIPQEEYAAFLSLLIKARKVIKKQKKELLPLYERVYIKTSYDPRGLSINADPEEKQFIINMIESFLKESDPKHKTSKYLKSFRDRLENGNTVSKDIIELNREVYQLPNV